MPPGAAADPPIPGAPRPFVSASRLPDRAHTPSGGPDTPDRPRTSAPGTAAAASFDTSRCFLLLRRCDLGVGTLCAVAGPG